MSPGSPPVVLGAAGVAFVSFCKEIGGLCSPPPAPTPTYETATVPLSAMAMHNTTTRHSSQALANDQQRLTSKAFIRLLYPVIRGLSLLFGSRIGTLIIGRSMRVDLGERRLDNDKIKFVLFKRNKK